MKVEIKVKKVNKHNYFIEKDGKSIWINPNSKKGKELLTVLGAL